VRGVLRGDNLWERKKASLTPTLVNTQGKVEQLTHVSMKPITQLLPRNGLIYSSPMGGGCYSHFDIKRVDSMTPEVLSIFCSDCIIRLEGKHLHSLLQPFEKIHRLCAFDDKKFDPVEEKKTVISLIELKEME